MFTIKKKIALIGLLILLHATLAGANLDGVDLSNKDLTGVNLSGVDLSNKDLTGVNLSGVDLSNKDLTGTILTYANLSGANLDGVDLSNKDLTTVNLNGVDLSNKDLTGTILTSASLAEANLDGVDLSNKDLTGVNLSGVDLSNVDLTGVNLSGVILRGVNLSGVDLSNKDLTEVNLRGVNLSGVDLSNKDLTGTVLTNTNLAGANLDGVDLSNKDLTGVNLSGVDLSNVDLTGVNLSGVNLSGVDLSNKDLTGTILTYANLSGANLDGVDFSNVDLTGVNLSGVDLSNKDLTGVNLRGVNLSGVDLSNKDLTGTILTNANLAGANLDGVDLSNKDLTGVNLSGVNLSGVDLSNVDLTGVILSGVDLSNKDLTGTILKDVIGFQEIFKKIEISIKNPSNTNWPSKALEKLQNLNVTRYDLSGDMQYLTTKEGFLFESKNNESRLVLDLNNDAQFPFTMTVFGGLVGLASQNKLVYVAYSSQDINGFNSLVVDEYSMNFSKVRNIIKIGGFFSNIHIGGALQFDSLGKLYLSVGDGSENDISEDHPQDLNDYRGKILRLDISDLKLEPEIIAYGIRNAYGVTIDSKDRMFILQCGNSAVEAVYFLNDLYTGIPVNFGWPVFEGSTRMRDDPLMFEDVSAPIFETNKRPGCLTAGVYLDDIESFVFGDFYGTIRLLKQKENGEWYLLHEYKQDEYIWGFGLDKKTGKIFVAPNNLELEISLEQVKLNQ